MSELTLEIPNNPSRRGLLARNRPDCFQTPAYALDPLLPYLKPGWRIWECACGKGNLVRGLCDAGFNAFGTDIDQQYTRSYSFDFLTDTQATIYDAIVTNPPFSLKDEFIGRCYALRKPWALLMPLSALEGVRRQKYYREYGVKLILWPRRVDFETPYKGTQRGGAWFPTAWFTWGLDLPSDLLFVNTDELSQEALAL